MSASEVSVSVSVADQQQLNDAIKQLVHDKVASRLTAQDATLWGEEAESEAAIRLAWTGLATSSRPLIAQIMELRQELAAQGIDRVVLAGMGGSSLAPEVLCATAGVPLVTLDTTDAGQVLSALDELSRTVVVVASKSGSTVETDSHRRIFEHAFRQADLDPAAHMVVVTDPGSPLADYADQQHYRRVFLADPHVGGRYSALTAFGLVPSGLAGVDIGAVLDDAARAAAVLIRDTEDNPGLMLGAALGLSHSAGAEKIVLADTGSGIVGFPDWAEQLIAESTGKHGRGLLPVAVEGTLSPGFVDAGTDAMVVALGPSNDTVVAASGFGAQVQGPLGGQMLLWEYAIAIAGRIIGINPFDQPDVESAKAAARGLLDSPAPETHSGIAMGDGITVTARNFVIPTGATLKQALDALWRATAASGYISVQVYLDRLTDAAAPLRDAIARATGIQTTFGWGPRFLHSTGQYHKGGHQNGSFLQIVSKPAQDLAVPDRPYSLGELQQAQAAGDAQVLADHGRPVLTVELADRSAGLAAITAAL